MCISAIWGCSHICGVEAVAPCAVCVCVWGGGPLGTFWLPTGLKPPSTALSALISYSEGVVNSRPNDFSVCLGVWAGAGEEL